MNVACSDNRILILQREIGIRKKELRSKLTELKTAQQDNDFLTSVVSDYSRYYTEMRRSKENEIIAMNMLIEYMDNVTTSTNLTKEALERTKAEQKTMMAKIKHLRREIEEITEI
tara:strand:- start:102 stop:446 length:345 start_codon:yes stop_codon:yes gene_type:complete